VEILSAALQSVTWTQTKKMMLPNLTSKGHFTYQVLNKTEMCMDEPLVSQHISGVPSYFNRY
jgi:hypothetical protein